MRPKPAIFVLGGPLPGAPNGRGPDLASRARGPQQNARGSQQKATEREGRFTTWGLSPLAVALGWPKSAIFAVSGSLRRASEGPGPRFCRFWRFPYSALLCGQPRKARARIWPNLAISVLGGPLQRASKGPGPDLAKCSYFCIKRSFTESLVRPGPRGTKI